MLTNPILTSRMIALCHAASHVYACWTEWGAQAPSQRKAQVRATGGGFCPVAFALPRQSHLLPRGVCVFFYLVCLLKHCYKGRVAPPKRINFCSKGGWGWCVYSSSTCYLFERCSLFCTGGQLMREERLISGLVTKHLVVDQI